MAPLEKLLQAASGRGAEMDCERAKLDKELASLEEEVAEKRAEKTIAAMEALKDLLKQKEALSTKVRSLQAAGDIVRQAVAKLELTKAAGLEDWAELREQRLKLSDFAVKKLKEQGGLESLKAAAAGGMLQLEGSALLFRGSAKAVPELEKALAGLESSYSAELEVDAEMLKLLEAREELKRLGQKHGVEFSQGSESLGITGPVEGVKKAETLLKFLLTGKAELWCPRQIVGAFRARAKEVEVDTGAFVDVARGGPDGSTVRIRGDEEAVSQAEDLLRSWFDEREGAYSVFVDAPEVADRLSPDKLEQLQGDLGHFGQKFGITAWFANKKVELRGPQGGTWESGAREELQRMLDFYVPPAAAAKAEPEVAKAKSKASAKAKAPEPAPEPVYDDWGSAPEAVFELGHSWK